jgi:hypothetical protein
MKLHRGSYSAGIDNTAQQWNPGGVSGRGLGVPGAVHVQGGGQKPRSQVIRQRLRAFSPGPVPPTQLVIVKVGHALGSVVVVVEEEEVVEVVVVLLLLVVLLAGAEVVVKLKMASQSQFPD